MKNLTPTKIRNMLMLILIIILLNTIVTLSPGAATTAGTLAQPTSGNMTNITKLPLYLQNLTKSLQENYADLVTIEHISDKFIVLRFGEIDSDTGWNSVKFVMDHTGFKIKNVLSSGLGSVGNPTRFFVVMTKE